MSKIALNTRLRAIEAEEFAPQISGNEVPGLICAANAALYTEGTFSEPLTTYAVGFRDPENIDAALEFFAPRVQTARRFEYATASSDEEFFSESADDLRAIGADFPNVEYTSTKVQGKTLNRGLSITVDLDQVSGPGWRENSTAKLLRRLKRNALRRAIALLSAAATNTAKTWDTTSGKDPDQDVIAELVSAGDISGVKPTRVGYGDTSWSKRALAHRAQSTAGGFASAGLTEDALAGLLGVDSVLHCKARYTSGTSAKTQIVNNLVLMFSAMSGADTEDASNIKRFVSPTESGGDIRVYEQQLTAKLIRITAEHYELIKITSTLGIRQFTVS